MRINGFKSAAHAGTLRKEGRLDIGLIVADQPAATAAVFTTSSVKAAPVIWSAGIVQSGLCRAILVNAGRANACTGLEGLDDAKASASTLAAELGGSQDQVLLASTGVIGERLNMEAIFAAIPQLVGNLDESSLPKVAEAMMTTDTVPKTAQAQGEIEGRPFKVVGLAKGVGMIEPNMATMLSFILTDAAVEPDTLKAELKKICDQTFNCITVDGDTSTNDTVFAMASGAAGNTPIDQNNAQGRQELGRVMHEVMLELARKIVSDGEGATKLVHVELSGAKDDGQARLAAKTVANSPLVKTAIFGEDPNWGRIMMALGRSGAEFDQYQVGIFFDQVEMVKGGMQIGLEEDAAEIMKKDEYTIAINLNEGPGQARIMTCDLSYEYVKINADYRS